LVIIIILSSYLFIITFSVADVKNILPEVPGEGGTDENLREDRTHVCYTKKELAK